MYALTRAPTTRTVYALPSGRFLLGALTAEQAAEQVFPQAKVTRTPGHTAAVRAEILSSAQGGHVLAENGALAYSPEGGGCEGVSLVKPALANTASGMALKFVGPAFAAGPLVGGLVLAGAAIAKVFGIIFSHHAAAVAKERSILCAAVPAANQSLDVIDQLVQSGQATPAHGMDALDAVLSGFSDATAAIRKGNDPASAAQCNAACVMLSALRAAIVRKKSLYQDLAVSQASSITGKVSSAIAGGDFSSLLPWAAAGLGLYLILKEG